MNKYRKVMKPREALVKDDEEIRVTAAGGCLGLLWGASANVGATFTNLERFRPIAERTNFSASSSKFGRISGDFGQPRAISANFGRFQPVLADFDHLQASLVNLSQFVARVRLRLANVGLVWANVGPVWIGAALADVGLESAQLCHNSVQFGNIWPFFANIDRTRQNLNPGHLGGETRATLVSIALTFASL